LSADNAASSALGACASDAAALEELGATRGQNWLTPPAERDPTNDPSAAAVASEAAIMARRSGRGGIASLAGSAATWPGASCAVSADDEVIAWPAAARAKSSAVASLASSLGRLCRSAFSTRSGPLPLSSTVGPPAWGLIRR
jgi:hypothetical protein